MDPQTRQSTHSQWLVATLLATVMTLAIAPARAIESGPATPTSPTMQKTLGIGPAQLTPAFWVGRLQQPDRLLLDHDAIAAQNTRLLRVDASMHDLRALSATLPGKRVVDWIAQRSHRPSSPLFDAADAVIPVATLDKLDVALDLDAIPETQPTRFGMVVQRAPLRTFPTMLRVFKRPGDTDIDRFQESALFPGTPVAILHNSRDGKWMFVLSPRYGAWVETRHVAEGSRKQVLEYANKTPYRLITGAKPRTTYLPGRPAVSELQLDMGVRLPLAAPAVDGTVDGQNPYTSWAVELPVRGEDGTLHFESALLPKIADSAGAPLPLTRANIVRQAFKFLGERYGWGHDYNARDCSGFVSEVYRSMGVLLPRNTGDQAVSPALPHTTFDDTSSGDKRGSDRRLAAVATLQVGDLVYIPGHVMLVIGRIDGVPWVIHDIQGGRIIDTDGRVQDLHLNAVAVTPLPPLVFDDGRRYIDRITSIVRIGTHGPGAAR